MKIRIEPPKSEAGQEVLPCLGTKVFLIGNDGTEFELSEVVNVVVSFHCEDFIRAKVEFFVSELEGMPEEYVQAITDNPEFLGLS